MQLFVLGMHRSGTSALARVLNLMGAYFGGEQVGTGRSVENVKGFWERRDVRELNDTMLFNAGCDWDCVSGFDLDAIPGETKASYATLAGDIVLNMDGHRPWFIKEPRLCLLFPIWREALESPFCIHMLRNPLEIAHSLKNRNDIPVKVGLALWEVYTLSALSASVGLPRSFVAYEDLMGNPQAAVEKLHAELEAAGAYSLRIPPARELDRFLDDALHRQRRSDRSLRSVANARQLALYEMLRSAGASFENPPDCSPPESSVEVLRKYEDGVDVDDRIARAGTRRQRRAPETAATEIAVKSLQLEHARSSAKDLSGRLGAAEREARQLRRTEIDVRTALAKSQEKAAGLASELERVRARSAMLAQQEGALRDQNAALESERLVLQGANSDLERSVADFKEERAALLAANAELEEVRASAEQTTRQLGQARATAEDLSGRLHAVEQETRELRRTEIEVRTALASSREKADGLATELERVMASSALLEQQEAELRDQNAALDRDRQVLRKANADLERGAADLKREQAALRAANAELGEVRAVAEQTKRELGQARASADDLSVRLRAAERETGELRRTEIDIRTALARSQEKADGLAAELERTRARGAVLEQQDVALRERNAVSERDRLLLQRDKADLKEEGAALRAASAKLIEDKQRLTEDKQRLTGDKQRLTDSNEALMLERTVLREANTGLEERRAEVEQARGRLEVELADLADAKAALEAKWRQLRQDHAKAGSRLDRATQEAAERRAEARRMIVFWDRELAERKEIRARLTLLAVDLRADIANLLASRRWRLGKAMVSWYYRLTLRRVPKDVAQALPILDAAHEAGTALIGDFATALDDTPERFADLVPAAPVAVDEILGSAPGEHGDLARQLFERAVELKRRARQLETLSTYVARLASTLEAMLASRSWRAGSFVVGAAYRLLRGRVPTTAADSALALVERYRAGPYAEQADRPAVPFPPPVRRSTPDETRGTAAEEPESDPAPNVRPTVRPSLPETGVDIVVCVHEALPDVQRCLDSVLARTALDCRLIVVNDGSGPETTTWLRDLAERQPNVELIETNGPLGYTCAANRGLRASSAPHVVLLNSDTIVPRLWLEDLIECLLGDDKLGIVGPLSNAASWQSVPERFADSGWAVNDLPPGYNVDEYGELVHRASERVFPRVPLLNGFCLLIRREVIDAIGYLDEEAFPRGYGEENDYCIRARSAGFELAVADQCFVYHAKSRSFGTEVRDRLARQGTQALFAKHGQQAIDRETARLKESAELARIRERLKSLAASRSVEPPVSTGAVGAPSPGGTRILFVLPVRGGSGGANSVVQEVAGMRSLGVDARVAVDRRHAESMNRFYADAVAADGFCVYGDGDELMGVAEGFDVIVATLWSTPEAIAPIAARWPEKCYAYYVQDYEPWFFPDDPVARAVAFDSYTRVPNMALMAKTDWICRTVREHHGVDVFRVAPSLDHEVFYPDPRQADGGVVLAAMIRPSTPRRGAERTLRVLREVMRGSDGLRILLFGCETTALEAFASAQEARLDFAFENRGILKRLEVAALLREADVFVDLSDYQAFGRTGLEAMACGCATVLPACGGVDEYAVAGVNALLVDTASFEETTAAVARLVGDRGLRERLAERALETAARYSVIRASLSELSVFRWAWTVPESRKLRGGFCRRGIEPTARP